LPDLVVTDTTSPASALLGERITLGWTVTNLGGQATGSNYWFDYVYWSADATLDGSDTYLTSTFVSNYPNRLAAGASYDQSAHVYLWSFLPTGAADLLFVPDRYDSPPEFDENNTLPVPFPREAPPIDSAPDLVVTGRAAPPVVTEWDTAEFTWTVTNAGAVTAHAGWTDRVY